MESSPVSHMLNDQPVEELMEEVDASEVEIKVAALEEEPEAVKFFTTSGFEQQPELKAYFEDILAIPYNKFCIDCQRNLTTHCIVWLGSFVCGDCAKEHSLRFGGNQYVYVKNIYNEQWDDYCLRSVALGGNKPVFDLFREYDIVKNPIEKKYLHNCVRWYKAMHMAKMDDRPFK